MLRDWFRVGVGAALNDLARLTRSRRAGEQRAKRSAARPKSPTRSVNHRVHPSQHYFAFISYSHTDEATAKWLHEALEEFRVPKRLVGQLTDNGPIPRRLRPIFRDRGELAASDNLSEDIEAALAGSRFLIVLCSPAAVASRWANQEIVAFKRFHPDGCLLAAIVDGEPFASEIPGREAEECFPPALRVRYDQRGRPTTRRAEPIAADLREGRDGQRTGLLKIIAGMLGVGLDDLVQRETHRRQKRLALLSIGSLIGMLIAIGLAVTALESRDAARDQRREAEGLISFMLGDLRSKLEPIGELEALDGVGSRVLNYYRRQDKSELSDAALQQRSRALTLLGEIAQLRGDPDGALGHYREAAAGTGELARRDPDNPQLLFDHAQNVFWEGWIARDRGQLDRAEAAMREYKRLADRMTALQPGNVRWRVETQNAHANLGIVLLDRRRFEEADRQFTQALKATEALSAADPGNKEYQQSLAEMLAWLAQAKGYEGRIDEAIAVRQRNLRYLNDRIAVSGGDVEFRQKLIPAYRDLGNLYLARGRIDLALKAVQASLREAEALIPREPANTKWLEFGGKSRLALAELLLFNRQLEAAAGHAEAGCGIISGLVAKDRSNATWRANLRDCHALRAQLALAAGRGDDALLHAGNALDAAEAVNSQDTVNDRFGIARAHQLIGDAYRLTGDGQSARETWEKGLSILPAGIRERPGEMSGRLMLLRRLDRRSEAQPIERHLASIGYRHPALR